MVSGKDKQSAPQLTDTDSSILPRRNRQALEYWMWGAYGTEFYKAEYADAQENLPRSQWPTRNGVEDILSARKRTLKAKTHPDHRWAELNDRW
jgi:hypothetical protein